MEELPKDRISYAVASLKRIVDHRGLSQPALADLSKVAQSTISKIFSGAQDPSLETLRKLYQALGLKLSDVLDEPDDTPQELHGYLATPLTGLDPSSEMGLRNAITGIRREASALSDPGIDLYWPGDHTHPTANPDFTPNQVYLIDRSRASTFDFIVLLCVSPSYGVGQENEIATQAGLPAIRIAPRGISRMMSGSFIRAIDIECGGSLAEGIEFDRDQLKEAFVSVRRSHFRLKASYKNLNGNTFGTQLRKLIHERSGSIEGFAEDLGISVAYLTALMEEQFAVSNPSARILKRMATLLSVPVSFLLGETPDAADPVYVESNASFRGWLDGAPGVDGALALRMRDDWRSNYRSKKAELSTASFRMASPLMKEADWDKRYRALAGKPKTSKEGNSSGKLF